MFAKAAIFTLVGAVAVSALDSRAVHQSVISRQLSADSVPSACTDTCSAALNIYNACLNGDTTTCLGVCQSDNYQGFIGCFSCILNETPSVTQAEVDELNGAIAQLSSACTAAGQTVSAASLTAPAGAASGTGEASGALASITGASFTSASGGLTVGGAAASSGGMSGAMSASMATRSAVSASIASGANAASSAVASVLPSGAANSVAQLPGFFGVAAGLVGVGAGALFVL